MKIIKTYDWNRRDFDSDRKCEFCGHIEKSCGGYDDNNYYQNVVPNAKCKKCGKSTNSENAPKDNIAPRYNENLVM